jgi:hypothetical protein
VAIGRLQSVSGPRALSPNRKPPDAVAPILNDDQRARCQFGRAFAQDRFEVSIHRLRTLVRQAKKHHARAVQDSDREQFSEVQIERQDDARLLTGAVDDDRICRAVQLQIANVDRVVRHPAKKIDRPRRDAAVSQEPHRPYVRME